MSYTATRLSDSIPKPGYFSTNTYKQSRKKASTVHDLLIQINGVRPIRYSYGIQILQAEKGAHFAHPMLHPFCIFHHVALLTVASAMTAIHRDRRVLASYTPWPGIQPLMPRGQILSGDFTLLTDTTQPQS